MSRRINTSERYWRNSLRQPTSLPTNVETTEVASFEKNVLNFRKIIVMVLNFKNLR